MLCTTARQALLTVWALLPAMIVPVPAAADTSRVIGDWTATCWTAARRCAAESDNFDRRDVRLTLSISRADGAGKPWLAGLRLSNVAPARGSAITVRIDDGASFRFAAEEGYVRSRSGRTVHFRSEDRVIELLRAVRAGRLARISFAAAGRGDAEANVSLRGTANALDWINARQHRRDDPALAPPQTASPPPPRRAPAMADKADARTAQETPAQPDETPAGKTPHAAAARSDRAAQARAVPSALLERHAARSDCEPLAGGALAGHPATVHALAGGKTLYIVPCYAGDGTLASRLYLVRDGDTDRARTLYFANFSKSLGWYGSDTLINARWNAATGMLAAHGEGGGKGGCGNAALYGWDGFDFRMIEYRAWDRCDGIRAPNQWPVIYAAPKD